MYTRIYEAIKRAVDNGETAGANVLVLKDGVEQVYCGYGFRDLEGQKPLERDTIFRLYSQTKPVTAAAVVLLASRGQIDLAAAVSDYLPAYATSYVNINGVRREAQRKITVRDLLNMTSGLAYPDPNSEGGRQSATVFEQIADRLYTDHPVTTAEFADLMAHIDLCFEPGECFQYGTSADVLGALVEQVAGKSFRDFLMEEFFLPLEMVDTDFYVPADKADRLTKAYDYSENGLIEVQTDHLGLRYRRDVIPAFQSGGAGLCSTLDDYGKFAIMLLNGGTYKGKRILPEYAVAFLSRGGLTPKQKTQLWQGWDWMRGYSYGNLMRVCENESETTLFSSKGEYGWDGWLGTQFSNEPAHGISMIYGTQQVSFGQTASLVRCIKNIVMSELA